MNKLGGLTIGNLLSSSGLAIKRGQLDLFIADKKPLVIDDVDDVLPECPYCNAIMKESGFCSPECKERFYRADKMDNKLD